MSVQHLQTMRTLQNSSHISVSATLSNLRPRPARSVQIETPEKNGTHHSERCPIITTEQKHKWDIGSLNIYTPQTPFTRLQIQITLNEETQYCILASCCTILLV
jgi:hypothetical protein